MGTVVRSAVALTIGAGVAGGVVLGAPSFLSAPAGAAVGYSVTGAAAGLRAHSAPDLASTVVRVLPNHAALDIACQQRSSSVVNRSAIWDELADGSWISDFYTTTPVFDGFSPGLSRCAQSTSTPPAPSEAPAAGAPAAGQLPAGPDYAVTGASEGVRAHNAPATASPVVRVIADHTPISITCQAASASTVNGSGIWDELADGSWVSDFYVTTPVFNGFSPGLARCASTGPVAPAPAPAPMPGTAAPREPRAVTWASAQIGSTAWDRPVQMCDRFVANAFGRTASGYPTAYAHWRALAVRGLVHPGDQAVPAGALAFFGPSPYNEQAGHVMLSTGGGRFLSSSVDGAVGRTTIAYMSRWSGPYLGWAWADPEWQGR